MLKLGVIIEGAPKAGYEIELALSYFKNLSVTKRYYLPLLSKLPVELPVGGNFHFFRESYLIYSVGYIVLKFYARDVFIHCELSFLEFCTIDLLFFNV